MNTNLSECVQAFGEAWAKRDIQTLDGLLAPGYVHTDFQGRVLRRAEWLAYANSQQHGNVLAFRDLEVTEYDTFGLVFGANEIEGGSMGASRIRFTQVWCRAGESWQRLAFQATLVSSSL